MLPKWRLFHCVCALNLFFALWVILVILVTCTLITPLPQSPSRQRYTQPRHVSFDQHWSDVFIAFTYGTLEWKGYPAKTQVGVGGIGTKARRVNYVATFTSKRPGVHIQKAKKKKKRLRKEKIKRKIHFLLQIYNWRSLGLYNITGFTRTNLLVLSYIVVHILLMMFH